VIRGDQFPQLLTQLNRKGQSIELVTLHHRPQHMPPQDEQLGDHVSFQISGTDSVPVFDKGSQVSVSVVIQPEK